ncbi:MAG: hypothetical protein P4N59_07660 [Negativicutes bacterium]|nr:hypothetical protein [Negativicutes bacterium]
MKRRSLLWMMLVLFVTLFAFSGVASAADIVGVWERVNDSEAGMQIRVDPNGTGTLIRVGQGSKFSVGTVKWSAIRSNGPNQWSGRSLSTSGDNPVADFTIEGNGLLKVQVRASVQGQYQEWERIR